MNSQKQRINKIAKFLREYTEHDETKFSLEDAIDKHIEHKTIVIFWEDKEKTHPAGVCRFNVIGEDTAHILEAVVSPQYKRTGLIIEMLLQGLRIFPTVKYLLWEREPRSSRQLRCKVEDFLKFGGK